MSFCKSSWLNFTIDRCNCNVIKLGTLNESFRNFFAKELPLFLKQLTAPLIKEHISIPLKHSRT